MPAAALLHDVVFVGGGISCLYRALRYKQQNPNAAFLVLERSNRVGGRVAWATFAGLEVMKGAGVGRLHNRADQLLLRLLQELGISYTVVAKHVQYYGDTDAHVVEKALQVLRRGPVAEGETFRDMGLRVLGDREYGAFIVNAGFRDFEALDAEVALSHYHFEDTHGLQTNFVFSWHTLVRTLAQRLAGHVVRNVDVARIAKDLHGRHAVHVSDGRVFLGRQVCVGVTVATLRQLFPRARVYEAGTLDSQPFMRIYALLNKPLPVNGFTVVNSVLQKILSTARARIYMIAYADNRNALTLRTHSKRDLEAELQTLFQDPSIRIVKYVKYFWQEGTHLYGPMQHHGRRHRHIEDVIREAQHPADDVYVVGEVVALNQGWVGSALLSTQEATLD